MSIYGIPIHVFIKLVLYMPDHVWPIHFCQQIIKHLLGARPEQALQESPKCMSEMEGPQMCL